MLLPEAQSRPSTGDHAKPRDDRSRRAFGQLVLVCLVASSLTACGTANGFQPLHGPTASGQRLDDRLATIEFATIPGRVGQRVRNELIFQRDKGSSATSSSAHRLEVTLKESVISTMIDRAGNTGSQIYQLEALYQLIDTKTKKVLFEGRSLGRGGFDRFESVYSNVRAREDAENRVARTVATDIKTRLSTYLSSAS